MLLEDFLHKTRWRGVEVRTPSTLHRRMKPLRVLSLEVCFVIEVHENPSLQVTVCNGVNGALNNTVQHCCSLMVLSCFFHYFYFFCGNQTHHFYSLRFFGHKRRGTLPVGHPCQEDGSVALHLGRHIELSQAALHAPWCRSCAQQVISISALPSCSCPRPRLRGMCRPHPWGSWEA